MGNGWGTLTGSSLYLSLILLMNFINGNISLSCKLDPIFIQMGLLDISLLSLSEHFKKKKFEVNYIVFPLGRKPNPDNYPANPTLGSGEVRGC